MDDIKQMYKDLCDYEQLGHWRDGVPDWIDVMKRASIYGVDCPTHYCIRAAWERIACILAEEKGW